MNIIKNKRYGIIIGIILLGCFLRLYEEEPSSLWTDELSTYWISSADSVGECIDRASPTQGQSPFYYILVWGILKNFQHSEFSLRFISLACSVISIFLIYYLAFIMFSEQFLFEGKEEREDKSLIGSDVYYSALFSALLFSISESAIYYAQEARPYSLAVMFCLLSQIFFVRMLKKNNLLNMVFYIIASSFICYSHYVFGTMILTQNIWILYLLLKAAREKGFSFIEPRADDISFLKWCSVQVVLILSLLPLAFHLKPILSEGDKWNWLQSGGFTYVMQVFGEVVDIKLLLFSVSLFIFLISIKNLRFIFKAPKDDDKGACCCFVDALWDNTPHILFFLFLWLITPPLFVYAVSSIGETSIISARYMTLSLIPLFLIGGWAVSAIKNKKAKYIFIGFVMFFCFANFLIPTFLQHGRFSNRITHDWRGALKHVENNFNKDDGIFIRTGVIKANWLTEKDDPLIREYSENPIRSFYFQKVDPASVYCFTFSYLPTKAFEDYYEKVYADLLKKERLWVIGITQPNGFPIQNVEQALLSSHKVVFRENFDGVYLALLVRKK